MSDRTSNAVTEFLERAIENSGLNQTEIADICGFERSTMVSMMKLGRTRVPYCRIKTLAEALGVDHLELAVLVIGEYDPGLLEIVKGLSDRRSRLIAETSTERPTRFPRSSDLPLFSSNSVPSPILVNSEPQNNPGR